MGCNECNHQYGPPSECWRLVRVHRRHLQDTIPVEAPPIIAILPLDTDWYASTKHELQLLFPLLSVGGVFMIMAIGMMPAKRSTSTFLQITFRLVLNPN